MKLFEIIIRGMMECLGISGAATEGEVHRWADDTCCMGKLSMH
jgi:hypothetical protein